MTQSFNLFLHCGGYWSPDDQYHGSEAVDACKHLAEGFTMKSVMLLVVRVHGYRVNMNKVSWFAPETPKTKEDVVDDEILKKVVHYAVGTGALTLFIVREDDPFIGRHRSQLSLRLAEHDEDGLDDIGDLDDIGRTTSDSENISEGDVGLCDAISNEDDCGATELNHTKCKDFKLGQTFKTTEAFKQVVSKYVVNRRRDIKYLKSDSTRVTAICSNGKCPWRIYASINSSSPRVVVRSFNDEHNCTWQGKVSLLTNARIAELYIEEFKINPDFSAGQLQEKLLSRNINIPWTICERTRLRCLQTFDNEQAEEFARLFDYVAELKRSNPGSIVA